MQVDDVTEKSKLRKGMCVSLKNMRVSPGGVTGAAETEPWVSRRIDIPRPDNGMVSVTRAVTVGPSGLHIGCNQGASVGCIVWCVHSDSIQRWDCLRYIHPRQEQKGPHHEESPRA